MPNLNTYALSRLKTYICLILTAAAFAAQGQSIRLTPYRAPSALYLNTERLYDFNLYEHNRFELGLTWVSPSESADPKPRVILGQWRAYASVAYGTMDHDLKYYGSLRLRLPGPRDVRLYLAAFDELEAAAGHTLESYQMVATDRNSHYLWSRFVGVKGLDAGCYILLSKHADLAVSIRQTWEGYRFGPRGLFYPLLSPAERQPVRPFTELNATLSWDKRAALVVRAGRTDDGSSRHYLSAMAQYDAALPEHPAIALFAQLGYATNGAPYSRLFDLSGTAGTPYFFRHTFLTLPPHSLVANSYAMLFVTYTRPDPLWKLSWSSPRLFAQLGTMYGQSFGPAPDFDAPLAAPDHGMAEAAAGIDRLLRWGLADFGVAAAFRICPNTAIYSADSGRRLALAAVATLSL